LKIRLPIFFSFGYDAVQFSDSCSCKGITGGGSKGRSIHAHKSLYVNRLYRSIATIYKSQKNYEQIVCDTGTMRALPMGNDEAFRTMGLLFGNDIISPRQLTVLKEEWLKPSHQEFEPRNLWSFYNAATESLKSSPPVTIMEKHIRLHAALTDLGKEASHVQNGTNAAGLLSGGARQETDYQP
jgi:hypothetical protein